MFFTKFKMLRGQNIP